MSIIEAPCNLTQQWTYVLPLSPKYTDGLYTIQHTSSKLYLTANKGSNSITLNSTPQTFFLYSENGNTNLWTTVYAGASVSPNDNPFGKLFALTPTAPLQIMSVENQNGIFLLQDGSIYNSQQSVYYIPSSDNKSVIPGNGKGTWTITSINCNVGQPFADGNYLILQGKNYLTGGDLVSITNSSPTLDNWQNYIWSYSKNTLSNCDKQLVYNANSQTFTLSTGPGSNIILSGDTKQNIGQLVINLLLTANARITILSAWTCGSQGSQFNFIPFVLPSLPNSIPSGTYQLQTTDDKGNSVCINSSGEVDSKCNTFWNYDATHYTLTNTSGQCLINSSTNLCDIKNLTIGNCSDKGANRFLLGSNNNIYDPQLGLCYNPNSNLIENYMSSAKSNKKNKRIMNIVLICFLVFSVLLLLFIIVKKPIIEY